MPSSFSLIACIGYKLQDLVYSCCSDLENYRRSICFLSVSFGHIEQARACFESYLMWMIHTSELIDHWMMSVELNAISLHWFQIDSSIQFFFVIFRSFLFYQKETFSSATRFCIANRRRTRRTEVRCDLVSDFYDQSTNIWANNCLVIFKAHKYAFYFVFSLGRVI